MEDPRPPIDLVIRTATTADARAIATIHVRSWQWAYEGLLPADYLAALSIEEREASWAQHLSSGAGDLHVWLASRGNHAVGFAAAGPARPPAPPGNAGEVYAIYLTRAAVGRGVGRVLLDRTTADLRARGFDLAALWVLETNLRARGFYEHAGWRADGESKVEPLACAGRRQLRYRLDFALS